MNARTLRFPFPLGPVPGLLVAFLAVMGALTSFAAPPVNDNFADATAITGASATTSLSNAEATAETDEPASNDATSVWWTWKAPATGAIQFDTAGSDFDTILSIYTGSTLLDLELTSRDDDSNFSSQSRAVFQATKDVTYFIAVSGYQGATGSITLTWGKMPPGQISVFRRTVNTTNLTHFFDESTPPAPGSLVQKFKDTSFFAYDPVNDLSAEISYGTDTSGAAPVKWFQVDYNNFFKFDVIPARLGGSNHWLLVSSATGEEQAPADPADPSFLGTGSLQGNAEFIQGLATPLTLGTAPNTVSFSVPRKLSGWYQSSEHRLDTFDPDPGDPFLYRQFQRSLEAQTSPLDLALTSSANLTDFNGTLKATVENAVERIRALLVSTGYVEQ